MKEKNILINHNLQHSKQNAVAIDFLNNFDKYSLDELFEMQENLIDEIIGKKEEIKYKRGREQWQAYCKDFIDNPNEVKKMIFKMGELLSTINDERKILVKECFFDKDNIDNCTGGMIARMQEFIQKPSQANAVADFYDTKIKQKAKESWEAHSKSWYCKNFLGFDNGDIFIKNFSSNLKNNQTFSLIEYRDFLEDGLIAKNITLARVNQIIDNEVNKIAEKPATIEEMYNLSRNLVDNVDKQLFLEMDINLTTIFNCERHELVFYHLLEIYKNNNITIPDNLNQLIKNYYNKIIQNDDDMTLCMSYCYILSDYIDQLKDRQSKVNLIDLRQKFMRDDLYFYKLDKIIRELLVNSLYLIENPRDENAKDNLASIIFNEKSFPIESIIERYQVIKTLAKEDNAMQEHFGKVKEILLQCISQKLDQDSVKLDNIDLQDFVADILNYSNKTNDKKIFELILLLLKNSTQEEKFKIFTTKNSWDENLLQCCISKDFQLFEKAIDLFNNLDYQQKEIIVNQQDRNNQNLFDYAKRFDYRKEFFKKTEEDKIELIIEEENIVEENVLTRIIKPIKACLVKCCRRQI